MDTPFPQDANVDNPYWNKEFDPVSCRYVYFIATPDASAPPRANRANIHPLYSSTRGVERAQLAKTFKGHKNAVSAVAFHPRKQILATVSDDETWKLWSVPNGDLIMSAGATRSGLPALPSTPGALTGNRQWRLHSEAVGLCDSVMRGDADRPHAARVGCRFSSQRRLPCQFLHGPHRQALGLQLAALQANIPRPC